MSLTNILAQIFLHTDEQILNLFQNYGSLTYLILFMIIFIETGVVVMPFLPGDSLLFVAGTIAGAGSLNIFLLFFLLSLAAILGDSVNYSIGKLIGPKIFKRESGLFFNKKHLKKTQKFYDKHGTKTIILARFVPFVRTFAPFVAGIGKMNYKKFLLYNCVGGIIWAGLFTIGGYFFGNIPIIKENLTIAILFIIFLSILPGIIEFVKLRKV